MLLILTSPRRHNSVYLLSHRTGPLRNGDIVTTKHRCAGSGKPDSNLDDGYRDGFDQSYIDVLAPLKKQIATHNSVLDRDRLDSAQLNQSPFTLLTPSGWPVTRRHYGRMHHSVVSQ